MNNFNMHSNHKGIFRIIQNSEKLGKSNNFLQKDGKKSSELTIELA